MKRNELDDEKWQKLEALLPPRKPLHGGRPGSDLRTIINGILWILRTGAPWLDLPARFGPSGTVSSRFYRWQQAGLWQQVLTALQEQGDAEGQLDWSIHYVDGTVIRAHQHAAGVLSDFRQRKYWKS